MGLVFVPVSYGNLLGRPDILHRAQKTAEQCCVTGKVSSLMKTQSSFDLNLAIQGWREDLARSTAFRSENLNELESHLRDSIDRLRTPQLSDEEAFLIATRRVGNTQRLEQEFGKVNGAAVWFDRCLWVLLAFQLWNIISSTSSFLFSLIVPVVAWLNEILPGFGLPKIEINWEQQTGLALGFSPLVLAVVAVFVWRYVIWPKRRGAAILQMLLRRPGALAAGLFCVSIVGYVGAAWALQTWYYHAQHYVYPPVLQWRFFLLRLPVLLMWAGLTYFFARKRLRSNLA